MSKHRTRMRWAVVFSLVIALALTMGICTDQSFAASKYVKSVSVSKSATVKVGATKTLKVKVKVVGNASKKFTATSTAPGVADVKVKGSKVIITGVSAGKATIKVKTKAKNNKKKTITKKIKVKVKGIAVNGVSFAEPTKDLTVGATYSAVVNITPSNATNQQVKFTTSNSEVATVSASGLITAISEGEARITVTTVDGGYRDNMMVYVKDSSIGVADKIAIQLTDTSLQEYWDTEKNSFVTMSGKTANMRVTLTRKGQAVGNQKVMLRMEKMYEGQYDLYRIEGEKFTSYETTNESSGTADFPLSLTSGFEGISPDDGYCESYRLTATLAGDDSVTATATISFATVGSTGIEVLNGYEKDIPALVPGINAQKSYNKPIAYTDSMNGLYSEEYVTSQQEGKSVVLQVYPYIELPSIEEDVRTGDYYQEINVSSEPYGVYNDETNERTTTIIEHIPAGLEYASIMFSDLSISNYTKMVVRFYEEGKNGEKTGYLLKEYVRTKDMIDQDAMVQQIPVQRNTAMYAVIALISEGQVDEDNNNGFTVAKITGKYKGTNYTEGIEHPLNNCVKWEQVNDEFYRATTDDTTMTRTQAQSYIKDANYLQTGYTYSYNVPRFPYAGNAIIKVKDANGNEVGYFTYPCFNEYSYDDAIEAYVYKNSNTIRGHSRFRYGDAVLISKQEYQNNTGTMAVDGNRVTLNTDATGFTAVKATLNLSKYGVKDSDKHELYSSVQWAPMPSGEEEITRDFFALKGQTVKVKAELFSEATGSPVTQSDKEITFTAEDETPLKDTGFLTGDQQSTMKTDMNGQCEFTLKNSTTDLFLNGLKATAKQYGVRLYIGNDPEPVESAAIHWVDVGLSFTDKVAIEDENGNLVQVPETITAIGGVNPGEEYPSVQLTRLVGSKWLIGVQTIAESEFIDDTYYIDKVEGVPVSFTQVGSSAESFAKEDDYSFRISSTKTGDTPVEAMIDRSGTLEDNVSFRVCSYDEYEGVEYPIGTFTNIGTGTANINAIMNLNISWTPQGVVPSIILPMGDSIDSNTAARAYVKVTDKYGNALSGKSVQYTVKSGSSTVMSKTATTNAKGLVLITLNAPGQEASYDITATVEGETVARSINFYVNSVSADFGIDTSAGKEPLIDRSANEVVVNMTRGVRVDENTGDFTKDFFYLEDTSSGTTYNFTEAIISDSNASQITLKLDSKVNLTGINANNLMLVTGVYTDNGIQRELIDNLGRRITGTASAILTDAN